MDKEKFIDMCFDILKTEYYDTGKVLNFYDLFELIYERQANDDGKMQNF